jgi:replicative DNA helicase
MHHARLIRQDGDRRRTISYLVNAVDGLKSGKLNLRELAVEAQAVLLPLALEEDGRGFRWISKQDVEEFLNELDRRSSRIADGLLPGIPTGFHQIDHQTQGFRPGEFFLIGGVPASKKTYMALNILINAAYGRIHSGFVSGEMYRQSLIERLLSAVSLTAMADIARGSITGEERERIVRDGARLENYIAIDDEAAPQLGDVIARCTELKANQPRLQIIAVDYIQIVQNKLSGRRGDEEIKEVCEALKGLALRLNVLMIAPAQANYKEVEARTDKRCELRDFQGGSAMVQFGDFVATIYNDQMYNPSAGPTLELDFKKTRRCSRFTCYLDYDPKSLMIYEKQKPAVRGVA